MLTCATPIVGKSGKIWPFLTALLVIPAGCWTSVHHAQRKQSIPATATLKRDVFGIIVRGLLTTPVLGSERAGDTGPRAKSLATMESKLGWFINRRTAGSGQAAICQMLIEQSPGGVSPALGGTWLLNMQLKET